MDVVILGGPRDGEVLSGVDANARNYVFSVGQSTDKRTHVLGPPFERWRIIRTTKHELGVTRKVRYAVAPKFDKWVAKNYPNHWPEYR